MLQAWAEAVKGVRGSRLDWPVFLTALGASACPVQARAELANFIRLLASGVRPATLHALLSSAQACVRVSLATIRGHEEHLRQRFAKVPMALLQGACALDVVRHLSCLQGCCLEQRLAVREEAGRAGAVEALLAVLRGSSHEPALQARLRHTRWQLACTCHCAYSAVT